MLATPSQCYRQTTVSVLVWLHMLSLHHAQDNHHSDLLYGPYAQPGVIRRQNIHDNVCQSQIENEHYSHHFWTIFWYFS